MNLSCPLMLVLARIGSDSKMLCSRDRRVDDTIDTGLSGSSCSLQLHVVQLSVPVQVCAQLLHTEVYVSSYEIP